MAKIKRNIGELVSGKIGKVVFVQMRGKSYVRAAPDRTKNNWSEAQVLYRKRLSAVATLWRTLNCQNMNEIWNLAAQEMNGYAWFIKKNMNALQIDGTLISPSLIRVVDGTLSEPLLKLDPTHPIPNEVKIEWTNDPHIQKQRLSDSLMMMTYHDHVFSEMIDTGYKRNQEIAVIPKSVPDSVTNLCYMYFFFKNEDDTLFTPSVNITVIPITIGTD